VYILATDVAAASLRDVNVELSEGTSCHPKHLAFLRESFVADAMIYDLKSRCPLEGRSAGSISHRDPRSAIEHA